MVDLEPWAHKGGFVGGSKRNRWGWYCEGRIWSRRKGNGVIGLSREAARGCWLVVQEVMGRQQQMKRREAQFIWLLVSTVDSRCNLASVHTKDLSKPPFKSMLFKLVESILQSMTSLYHVGELTLYDKHMTYVQVEVLHCMNWKCSMLYSNYIFSYLLYFTLIRMQLQQPADLVLYLVCHVSC